MRKNDIHLDFDSIYLRQFVILVAQVAARNVTIPVEHYMYYNFKQRSALQNDIQKEKKYNLKKGRKLDL